MLKTLFRSYAFYAPAPAPLHIFTSYIFHFSIMHIQFTPLTLKQSEERLIFLAPSVYIFLQSKRQERN